MHWSEELITLVCVFGGLCLVIIVSLLCKYILKKITQLKEESEKKRTNIKQY